MVPDMGVMGTFFARITFVCCKALKTGLRNCRGKKAEYDLGSPLPKFLPPKNLIFTSFDFILLGYPPT